MDLTLEIGTENQQQIQLKLMHDKTQVSTSKEYNLYSLLNSLLGNLRIRQVDKTIELSFFAFRFGSLYRASLTVRVDLVLCSSPLPKGNLLMFQIYSF